MRLGDIIANVSHMLGIKHCEKCERRRVILNDLGSVGIRETARRLKSIEKELNDCCD